MATNKFPMKYHFGTLKLRKLNGQNVANSDVC